MTIAEPSAGAEWRRYGIVPIAAALGYATSVIHIYSLGPFIGPVSASFHWSRSQVAIGLTLSTMVQAVASVPVGLLVDRYGPRRFGLAGVLLTLAAFAPLIALNTISSLIAVSMFQIVSPGAHASFATECSSASVTFAMPSCPNVTGRSTESMSAM